MAFMGQVAGTVSPLLVELSFCLALSLRRIYYSVELILYVSFNFK